MGKDRIEEDRGKPMVTIGEQSGETGEVGEQEQQLLPGILNDITLEKIAPKLPWRTFHILSAVSRGWRQSNQSRRVYDTRVHSSNTEALIVHCHDHHKSTARIGVYSMIDDCCYELPPIPGVYRGVPRYCQCISLNGKIYVLGGGASNPEYNGIKEVHVLDVAGHCQWKRCADTQEERHNFGCGVINGKIYVFGGCHRSAVKGSEVYDPEINAWSSITPMVSWRHGHSVSTLGEKLIVHGGNCIKPYAEWRHKNREEVRWNANCSEVYDPAKDVWTVVGPGLNGGLLFVAQVKLHWIDVDCICVQDVDGDDDSWKVLHSNSFPHFFREARIVKLIPRAVLVVNDELFLRVVWNNYGGDPSIIGSALLHSKGFGSENQKISWQVFELFLPCLVYSGMNLYICIIQLLQENLRKNAPRAGQQFVS